MFLGSIPKKIAQELTAIKNEKVIVLGSGNYRSEMSISQNKSNKIISTDISAYSSILGWYFSGEETRIETIDEYSIINNYSGAEYVAAIIQMMDMTQLRDIENDRRKKKKMFQLLDSVIKERAEKIEKIKSEMTVERFIRECMTTVYKKPEHSEHLILAFPPTYAKGYEKMFKGFSEKIIDQMPPYSEINDVSYMQLCDDIVRRGKYILYTDRELDFVDPVIKYSEPKKKDVFVYSDYLLRKKYIFTGNMLAGFDGKYERATIEDIRETGIQVSYVSIKIENYFREVYIKKAVPSTPQNSVALLVSSGEKLVGFILYSTGKGSTSYLWADYVVTDINRISKLVLRIAKTREAVILFDGKYVTWTNRLKTTVFTKSPVSMKYRGVFELMERKEGKLIYEADVSDNTIDYEVKKWLESWKEK